MWLLVIALLVVVGCATTVKPQSPVVEPPEPEPEPEPEPVESVSQKQYPVSFAIDPTDEKLMTAFQYAVKTWNEALEGEWVTIKDESEGEVPVYWVETVTTEDGCVTAAD